MQITEFCFFDGPSIMHSEKYVLSVYSCQLVFDLVRNTDFSTLSRLIIKKKDSKYA
jgi:hypothetical protein